MGINVDNLRNKRIAVGACYFVPGVVFASWASRIPDVKELLHLSNGQLGSVLFAIPIGQLLMMAFSGILVSRFGSKKMLMLSEFLYAASLFAIGFCDNVLHLIMALVALGMMANLMNKPPIRRLAIWKSCTAEISCHRFMACGAWVDLPAE